MVALVFDRELDAAPGRVDVLAPRLRRVLAPNPGPFTFLGTGTYIIGRGEVAVIDPGPADEAHLEALLAAVAGERVTHVLVTHTHADHSPGARPLAERTGAVVLGCAPHPEEVPDPDDPGDTLTGGPTGEHGSAAATGTAGPEEASAAPGSETPRESVDRDHAPHRLLADGDTVEGTGWRIEAVHTPGHISNHLCFAWTDEGTLFSGDHVMRWSTSVISPPTGDLRAYLSSLRKVADRPEHTYWPTHGPAVRDPQEYVPALAAHRQERTAQIRAVLAEGPASIPAIVAACYPGLDERLVKAAGRSVLSHLLALRDDGDVTNTADPGTPPRWVLGATA